MKRSTIVATSLLLGIAGVSAGLRSLLAEVPNSTGKLVEPIDAGVPVGSFPVQMRLSPDGKYLVVTNSGSRQQLSVIDAASGRVVATKSFNGEASARQKESLYWGLDFDADTLAVSRGPEDKVSFYRLGADGSLTFLKDVANPRGGRKLANFVSGVALSGKTLYAVNNETGADTSWQGSVSEIDHGTGQVIGKVAVGGFPLGIVTVKSPESAETEVFVTCEQDGIVSYFLPNWRQAETIRTGTNPTGIIARDQRLYVSNSGSDTVSIIDAAAKRVVKTILLRPAALRGLPSCTPLGLDLAADGSKLYVACADLNAVAIVDVASGKVDGYLPTGWYPTDVKLSRDGTRLFVSNAKGAQVRNPNGKPVGTWGTYILDILEGTVSMIRLDKAVSELPRWTAAVLHNNRLDQKRADLRNPGIKHVIYIIKENRTYDNVLGDLPGGNGDPSLCLFPREVTPNQHALAERFVLLDNFYCCAEVSGDGWNWSTAGAANEYVSRNVPFNYSDRGRDYDFEGEINGKSPEVEDVPDVATPPGGYLWDACRKKRVSMRNYGFFVGSSDAEGVREGAGQTQQMEAKKKALVGITDSDFNQFDMDYPDSNLTASYGVEIPSELKSFGRNKSPNRFAEWKREFDDFVRKGSMPSFQMVRFCRDHTAGTARGKLTARGMVADNDYAVGLLVEAVSHSKFWQDTVICIVEDDAQNGIDHVDCHRSIAFIVSPFIKPGTRDSRFYNTDSMIRTMELILGLSPMNGYDAVADPINCLGSSRSNLEPYVAIRPSKELASATNKPTAYRSRDSDAISRYTEESGMDEQLNDILWHSIKRLGR